MKEKRQRFSRWFYARVLMVVLLGSLLCAWMLQGVDLGRYPAMISEAYDEPQHRLTVPGTEQVRLTRGGAYGIYYEYEQESALVDQAKMPPEIDCSLSSKSTEVEVRATPDYIETNRYWTKNRARTGVLIMSITVNRPDTYTFACQYRDGSTEPEIIVALGPNYVWEFLRVMGKIGLSLTGAAARLCGSVLIGLVILAAVALRRRRVDGPGLKHRRGYKHG